MAWGLIEHSGCVSLLVPAMLRQAPTQNEGTTYVTNNQTIQRIYYSARGESGWWDLFRNKKFEASLPNEEEARRVIWLKTGKEVYITEDMMTPVSLDG